MFVASGLSVNYPQTMEGNKGNRQDMTRLYNNEPSIPRATGVVIQWYH